MVEDLVVPEMWTSSFAYGWPYITGNVFASMSKVSLNYGQHGVLSLDAPTPWHFCKIDYIGQFIRGLDSHTPIVLVTANSDYSITDEYVDLVFSHQPIIRWFTTNPCTSHPKVTSIPLGLGNEGSRKSSDIGNIESTWTMRAVQDMNIKKERLLFSSFDIETNPDERGACSKAVGGVDGKRYPYPEFLQKLAGSMFCAAPVGNGIDTHRAWESLYLKTVPIVTKSKLWDEHPDLPALVIDSWKDFDPSMISEDKYAEITDGFDWQSLYMYRYARRMHALVTGKDAA